MKNHCLLFEKHLINVLKRVPFPIFFCAIFYYKIECFEKEHLKRMLNGSTERKEKSF
jgi:hypothetical protein